MGVAVGVDEAREGFWGGHVEVGGDVAVGELAGDDEVENVGGEVGAVGAGEGVAAVIGVGVDGCEDLGVLLGRGADGVEQEIAIEGGAYAFFPVAVAGRVRVAVLVDAGG